MLFTIEIVSSKPLVACQLRRLLSFSIILSPAFYPREAVLCATRARNIHTSMGQPSTRLRQCTKRWKCHHNHFAWKYCLTTSRWKITDLQRRFHYCAHKRVLIMLLRPIGTTRSIKIPLKDLLGGRLRTIAMHFWGSEYWQIPFASTLIR